MLSSIDNPKIKSLIKLSQAKYRKQEKQFLVEGAHLVAEARLAGVLLEAYSVEEKKDYIQVSAAVMKRLCNTDSLVKEVGLCKMVEKNKISDKVLILDGIQDPGNMGSLLRSACAFGFETIFVGAGSVDIYNDKVIRSSQGAIFKLNFIFGNPVEFIKSLKHKVYGTNVVDGIPLKKVVKENQVAIVLGNEGNGISKEVQALKLENIFIPMNNTESLNVSVAGSIILYELSC
ncbi:MAG: RNA methyltransferase [Anaeroplasmataceae bacterium]|nr:RNA methyltransferase [Anaeroplasmataceae bacterium]